jgi:hypothetical protein
VLIISLIVAALAVARITRLLVDDQLTVSWRQRVVKRFGADSMPAYLAHCPWCVSMWVAPPFMMISALFPYPWVVGLFSIPAASLVTGIISQVSDLLGRVSNGSR